MSHKGFCQGDFLDERILADKSRYMSSWEDFVSEVIQFSSPLRQPFRDLSSTVTAGIWQRATLSAAEIAAYRTEQMARIRRVVAADGPSTQPRWGVLQRLAEVAGHPDKALAEDAQQPDGFRLLGRLPVVPQWPQRPEPLAWDDAAHVRDLQRLLDKHAVKQKDGRFKVPGSHSAELHRLLEEETTKGFWTSYSWSEARQELGDFACWLYFGVQEPSKLRGCLDPEEANGPSMVLLPNQVLMAGLDGYLSLCQTVAAAFKKKGQFPALRGFAEDYEHGFRQLPLSSLDRKLFCATAQDKEGNIRIYVPRTLLFGPRGSPHVFCRVTDAVSAIAAVLLLIPNVPHVDDLVGVDTQDAIVSAREAFVELHELLNFRLKATKARPPRDAAGSASTFVALGALLSFDTTEHQRKLGLVCTVDMPQQKVKKYSDVITSTLAQRHLSAAVAGKCVGQWDHCSALALGKSGRAFTWPLRELSRGGQVSWRVLQAALVGFSIFMCASGPMPVHVPGTLARRAALIFVDAAGRANSYRLGGVAWGAGWFCFFSQEIRPEDSNLLPWLSGHCINEAEALAAVVALLTWSDRLENVDVFIFIDNVAAEGVLVKAYSSSPHLTVLAGLFWQAVRRVKCSAWVGRVPSELNIADGPSRKHHAILEQLHASQVAAVLPPAFTANFFLEFLQSSWVQADASVSHVAPGPRPVQPCATGAATAAGHDRLQASVADGSPPLASSDHAVRQVPSRDWASQASRKRRHQGQR
ncbi:unnamed protein product [Symbiodinium natans]|uniref:Uncharacterized protein n=1 Tax=Symbiodinium natans TaxID=878477 RepID=A0A812QDS2_9DINO|nr:unnamed protein product [Symbiodinium natans]